MDSMLCYNKDYFVYFFLSIACKDSNRTTDKWLSRLSSCGWLGHVKELLNVACLVAQCIDRESK